MTQARLALLLALAPSNPRPPAAEQPSVADAFPLATPESQGLSQAAFAELDGILRGYLQRQLFLGAELLVIKNRRTVFHEVYGDADRDAAEPWVEGTVCNIRSMTKTLTGAAAQILIDRGALASEDRVAEYLPGFEPPAAREITVEQLLTHRSGLPLTILESMDQFPALVDMGNAVGARGPEYEIGSRFWYSDSGTDALGALVEVASGKRLDEFIEAELLKPLAMDESFYYLDDEDPRRAKIASLYIASGGGWTRFWNPDEGAFYPFAWGSQSLYSTPRDYAKFLCMWLDGGRAGAQRILSSEAIARSLTPVSEMSMLGSEARFPTSFTGLEVYYGQMSVLHVPLGSAGRAPPTVVGHSGSDGTIAWAWPERDLLVLLFTQSRGGSAVLRFEEALDRVLISPQAYATEAAVPEELKPYLGVYVADWANHMKEEFVVHVKRGKLAIDVPSQMDFELEPTDGEEKWSFTIAPTITAWFEADESGTIDCLRIQQGPMTFEAPRKGTPHASRYYADARIDEDEAADFLGTYDDPDEQAHARVRVDGDYLAIENGQGQLFHLWDVPGEPVWIVRENPLVSITFQYEDGVVVSFTRSSALGDTTPLVYPRIE